jgi:hypothetical protein
MSSYKPVPRVAIDIGCPIEKRLAVRRFHIAFDFFPELMHVLARFRAHGYRLDWRAIERRYVVTFTDADVEPRLETELLALAQAV